ncbi:hypothetical protein GUJ93_ZPchr0010g10889 [Zizania palustris]|uniref:F-actin-capping protein subunit beta n=1 Tax=Zizania palustris TaxID=103762 RepID=A0A8J5WCN6_ZIZPA|nr:hypothetical protein GUJ93_ZPchr0010g10889 [Zizania palustris]
MEVKLTFVGFSQWPTEDRVFSLLLFFPAAASARLRSPPPRPPPASPTSRRLRRLHPPPRPPAASAASRRLRGLRRLRCLPPPPPPLLRRPRRRIPRHSYLVRRMPPGSTETALNALLSLLPDHSIDLLSQVDLPLQVSLV